MSADMYVCPPCHRKVCHGEHLLLTWASCDACGRTAECVECASGLKLVDRADAERQSLRRMSVQMYLHAGRVEYPKEKP
jgi:transcription initiation factor IIE alpha subunit